jgi:hypothetical protein
MKNQKIVLAAILAAARAVFASKMKVLIGNEKDADPLNLENVKITGADMPRVMVVGIANALGVPRKDLADLTALDLGETEQQVTNNLSSLQNKYEQATKYCMSMNDGAHNIRNGAKRFALKHQLMLNHIEQNLEGVALPSFPYVFKRVKYS